MKEIVVEEAMTKDLKHLKSFKFQYSVTISFHNGDLSGSLALIAAL